MFKRKHKYDTWTIIAVILLGLYIVFLIYPLINLLRQAILTPEGNYTMENFKKFFSQKYYLITLLNSLKVTVTTTILSLLIGAPLAYFFTMYTVKGEGVLRIFIILASMSAPFIGAYSWILLLGRSGVFTQFFQNTLGIALPDIYGFNGIILVLTLQLYPLVFLYVSGALKNIDNSLLEASRSLGYKGFDTFKNIILPLIMPTLLASALLVFMRALADFGTPRLIGEGYRIFPVLIYEEFMSEVGGDDGFAAAISVIAVIITAVVFLLQKGASSKFSYSMSSLNTIEKKKAKGPFNVFIHIFSYFIVGLSVVPQFFVTLTSFRNTRGLIFVDGYSLDNYRNAVSKLGSSIQNTFIISGAAILITILAAVLIAYLTVRRKNIISETIDLTSMLAYIIPGSVLGIAMLISFNKPPLILSGGFLIMIISLVIRRLPYTIRSSTAILQQIPITIEEASISLGTPKLKTFFTITIPMMANGIISGAILSWITMITELSTSIILYTGRTRTLTVSIYVEVLRGNYGIAAALSTILTILTISSLIIFTRFSKSDEIAL